MERVFNINNEVEFILSEKKLVRLSDGYTIKLRSPASFCLTLLLDRQGELVSHKELFHYGWERFGMPVSQNVLHNAIFYLRKYMSEIGFESDIIETINRRGFIFTRKLTVITYKSTPDNENHTNETEENHCDSDENPLVLINESYEISVNDLKNDLLVKNENASSAIKTESPSSGLARESSPFIYNVPTPDKQEKKSSLRKERRYYKIFFITLCSLLIIIYLIMSYILYANKEVFPAGYSYVGKFDQCHVYQNKLNFLFKKMKASGDFISECKSERYLYITSFIYSNYVSIISCSKKISLFSTENCISSLYIYKDNGGIHE
ncbi:winged helix-turn-helix domain-containing protein [Pantoea ananatis]|uniref:winged helix-turn-helix domain-containing protein n=1 Tax=Pantoea ananas TaxID=553 RepID=UPI0018909A92|nr:winged helix-turn-helix domain-containing protein [Pantoea ananatis]